MMFPHWKYALSVFGIVFAIAFVVIAVVVLFGAKVLTITVTVGGLLFMFYVIAKEGPR